MKQLTTVFILAFAFSCNQHSNHSDKSQQTPVELYNTFDKENHLKPDFDKKNFDTLKGWEFGWAILEPINIADCKVEEKDLARRLSSGQKALYFIWYLDAEVTNGGFIQFYWNNYRKYLPPIIDGLHLIGDKAMLNLVDEADREYLKHMDKFILQRQKNDWQPLYDNLKAFDGLDSLYYVEHDNTMKLIEAYARKNPDEFVNLK